MRSNRGEVKNSENSDKYRSSNGKGGLEVVFNLQKLCSASPRHPASPSRFLPANGSQCPVFKAHAFRYPSACW